MLTENFSYIIVADLSSRVEALSHIAQYETHTAPLLHIPQKSDAVTMYFHTVFIILYYCSISFEQSMI